MCFREDVLRMFVKVQSIAMSHLTRQYLLVFFVTGVPFAVLLGMVDYATGDFHIWKSILQGFFFGVAMSLTLVTLQRYRMRKVGIDHGSKDDFKTHQEKELVTWITPETLFTKLREDPVFGKMDIKPIGKSIEIRTRATWWSFGERIRIDHRQGDPGKYIYHISSKPLLSTTVMDYGKNKENVDRIALLLHNTD